MCARSIRARLVLADDHRPFAAACESLARGEFEVAAVVHAGRDALDAVARHDPDILVLDITMPGLTGTEVLEELRRRGARTRVVVLSVHQDEALVKCVFALGGYAYVAKPRMAQDLLPSVRAALAGRRFCSPLPAR